MVIIIKKINDFFSVIGKKSQTYFQSLLKNIKNTTESMRFTMVATYFGVILVTLVLMCIYIIGLLSDNLYKTERVDMYAKANIIALTISDQWDDNIHLSEMRFGDVIEDSLAGTSIRGVVTNASYTVIYDTNRDSNMVGKAFMRDILKEAVDGEQSETVADVDGMRLMAVAVPVKKNGEAIGGVYLARTVNDIEETVDRIRTSLIVFSILIVIIIGMLSLGLSYIITSPIAEFTRAAKEISKGNFKYRVNIKTGSEMKQMAEMLNFMCDELSNLDEQRKKFVSDASHELKTPMAGIKLICDSLVETPDIDPDTLKEFLGDMSEEVDRLTRIVNRLLVLTKLDSSGMSLKLEETDIAAMLDRIIMKLSGMAQSKNIELAKEYESVGPVICDYDKIYEAVYNITDNAIKYTPDDGKVFVALHKENDNIVISIEDTGVGIPESEREKIFERFYRVDDSRARTTGGTGLGLAIAREAVAMHGGSIEITDGADGGSRFNICLPVSLKS